MLCATWKENSEGKKTKKKQVHEHWVLLAFGFVTYLLTVVPLK